MKPLNLARLEQNIQRRAAKDIENGILHGAAVIVNQAGKRVYTGYLGTNGTGGAPLAEGTLYRAASMTKPITAVAVMREMEQGHLQLDDPISAYLPRFGKLWIGKLENGTVEVTGAAQTPVRIRHLLSHSSGIVSGLLGDHQHAVMPQEFKKTLADAVDYYAEQPLAFEPFTACDYSPMAAFDLLARIVEITSGESYDAYLQAHLFEPLGMKDTTFTPSSEQWSRMVTMHNRLPDGTAIDGATTPGCVFGDYPTTYLLGGAGLATTAEDYSLFAEMLLSEGMAPNGKPILSPSSVQQMRTPQVPEAIMPGRERWGLGMRVITATDTVLPQGAFGWSGAYGTHFWVDPVNRITAIFMKNSYYDGGSGAVTSALFEEDVMQALN